MDERVNQTALDIVHIHNYRSLLKYWISEASHVVMPLFVALLLRVLTVVFLRLLGAQAEDKTHGERPLIFGECLQTLENKVGVHRRGDGRCALVV